MKEQDIQRKIIKHLEQCGCYSIKVIAGNRAGIPDIIACCQGKFIGIEVKQKGNKPTELQLVHLERIADAGGYSLVAYSLDDVTSFLNSLS